MTVEPPESDTKTNAQIIEEIWANRDRDYNSRRLVKRLQRVAKQMSGDARELFARFLPDGDVARFAEDLPAMLRADFTGTMQVLRDADFQKLLLSYPRPRRSFFVAPSAVDEVSSEWLIKGGTGREYKPADYLELFAQFVSDNADQIEALSILLSRPEGWGAEPLKALRDALVLAPEHFTEANLQRAFGVTYHKGLADIISMVKRAAEATSPLYTAEERVAQASNRVVGDRELTAAQDKWMALIQRHLVANLSIDRVDFDLVPVLSDRGGWAPANRAFGGKLAELLASLNKELVAA